MPLCADMAGTQGSDVVSCPSSNFEGFARPNAGWYSESPMAKDSTDDDDDEPVTDINVQVDLEPPMSAPPTARAGVARPVADTAAAASPANSEPSTLKQPMSVTGLASPSPGPVEMPAVRRPSDDVRDVTSNGIDARVRDAYDSARSVEATLPAPEEITDTPRKPRHAARTAPTLPNSAEVNHDHALTTKLSRYVFPEATHGNDAETAPTIDALEIEVEVERDEEDETATDVRRRPRSETHAAVSAARSVEATAPRLQHDVRRELPAPESGALGSLPASTRILVGLEEARSPSRARPPSRAPVPAVEPPRPAAGGPGTLIRRAFNASLGAAMTDGGGKDGGPAQGHPQAPQPALVFSAPQPHQVATSTQPQVPPPPPTTRRATRRGPDPPRKPKKRAAGKTVFLLFIAVVALGGAGAYYREEVASWAMQHLPEAIQPSTAAGSIAPPPGAAAPTTSASASGTPSASQRPRRP